MKQGKESKKGVITLRLSRDELKCIHRCLLKRWEWIVDTTDVVDRSDELTMVVTLIHTIKITYPNSPTLKL